MNEFRTAAQASSCRFCAGSEPLDFIVATNDYTVNFCRDCRIYQTRPHSESFAVRDTLPWENRTWALMSKLSRRRVARERTRLLRRILPLANQSYDSIRLLEIGSGDGFLLAAADRLGVGSVLGLEISSTNCKNIRAGGLPVIEGNAATVSFPAGSFDIIVMSQVVEHFENPKLVLERVFAQLRPGGLLHIDTPTPENIFAKMTGYRVGSAFDADHLTLFTRDSLDNLLSSVGFDVVGFRGFTGAINLAGLLVYGLAGLRHKKAWSREAAAALPGPGSPLRPDGGGSAFGAGTNGVRSRLKDVVTMVNWGSRLALGYALAPVWTPIAGALSRRPGVLALMEVQAKKP